MQVMAELAHDVAGGGCELTLSTKSDSAVIVNVAVFDWEGGASARPGTWTHGYLNQRGA